MRILAALLIALLVGCGNQQYELVHDPYTGAFHLKVSGNAPPPATAPATAPQQASSAPSGGQPGNAPQQPEATSPLVEPTIPSLVNYELRWIASLALQCNFGSALDHAHDLCEKLARLDAEEKVNPKGQLQSGVPTKFDKVRDNARGALDELPGN